MILGWLPGLGAREGPWTGGLCGRGVEIPVGLEV